MDYLVGDLQGCADALDRLAAEIAFSPSRDRLFVLGDLVNRGPASLRTLERLRGWGDAAQCLLGNHDLHLLAVAEGVRPAHRNDTFADVLDSAERAGWIDWLRRRPLALRQGGWLLVHAGVLPQWDAEQTLALAWEVEAQLAGHDLREVLLGMYGNEPARWSDALQGAERARCVINALTRLRFVEPDGTMQFGPKGAPDAARNGIVPWFDAPGRRSAGQPIAFGHWSTLGKLQRDDLLALDTGCVWGGALSAVRIDGGRRERFEVPCPAAQQPGND